MKKATLPLEKLISPDAFHEEIAKTLDFPCYYGKNLDALYDCLTDIIEPTEIVFPQKAEESAYLGEYAAKVICVLKDAEIDNDSLKITIS